MGDSRWFADGPEWLILYSGRPCLCFCRSISVSPPVESCPQRPRSGRLTHRGILAGRARPHSTPTDLLWVSWWDGGWRGHCVEPAPGGLASGKGCFPAGGVSLASAPYRSLSKCPHCPSSVGGRQDQENSPFL